MKDLGERLSAKERARALINGDGGAIMRGQHPESRSRSKMRQLLKDPDWVDDVMEDIAAGVRMTEIARMNGVKFSIFHTALKNAVRERLEAARAAFAEEQIHKNLELADDMQAGRVEPAAGKAAAGIRQWYAERASNDDWGQKSTTNVNVKGAIGLHMEALKQFTDEPLVGEFEEVEDAEDSSPAVTDSRRHPLL